MREHLVGGASLLALIAVSGGAYAQDRGSNPAPPAASTGPSTAAPAPAPSMTPSGGPAVADRGAPAAPPNGAPAEDAATVTTGRGIQEIVVTAQRRTENLQRAALAVSAVDAAGLKAAGVTQPQDLTKVIPALQLAAIGGSETQVTIRGVGNFAPFIYVDPAVAINYDGVYLARSAAPNGLFFDLERVEVLKGPQGTLYGRNATGGAINIITAKPKLGVYSVEADAEFGSYDLKRGSVAVNLPVSDTVAVRVAAQAVDRNGYLSDGYLDDKGQAARGELLWKPDNRLTVNLEADFIHQGGKGPAGVFVTPQGYLTSDPYAGPTIPQSNGILQGASLGITNGANPNFVPPFTSNGFTNLNIYGGAITVDYDFGAAKLTAIGSFRHTQNKFLQYAGGFPVSSTESSDQGSFEVRLASQGDGPLKWVLGAYYFHDDSTLYALADQGITSTLTLAPDLPVQSVAVFAQSTYSLTPRLRVTGGIRYTNEQKSQVGSNLSALPPVPAGFPAPAAVFYQSVCQSPATLQLAQGACLGPFSGDAEFNKVTGKVGLEYDLRPRSLLYASVETGFKAGGFYPSLAPNTYRPEEITAYTVGLKNRFFDNTLQINFEGFYWDYSDKQVTHLGAIRPFGYSLITENAGGATIAGFETDVVWRPTATDRFNGDLQYTYSNYDTFQYNAPLLSSDPNARAFVGCPQTVQTDPVSGQRSALVDCSGRSLPLAPEFVLNMSYDHTFLLGERGRLEAIVGTKIQSSYYSGEDFLVGEKQGTSTVSYASLTYSPLNSRFSIGGYVDNIEDEAVKASAFAQPVVGLPVVILRPPRTYGVRLGVKF